MSPSPEVNRVSDVVAKVFVDDWTTRCCFFDVSNCGQVFVVDHDEINCIARRVAIGGNDGGDRMSDEVNLVLCEHAMIGNFQLGQCARAGHWSNLVGDVLAGINSDDARSRPCSVTYRCC